MQTIDSLLPLSLGPHHLLFSILLFFLIILPRFHLCPLSSNYFSSLLLLLIHFFFVFNYFSLIEPKQVAAMVLKTELCRFSGAEIYPGRGIRFIRSDSQVSCS
ncbi:putative ribosomal protein L24e [Rosa chinensis]|uniref:Putative ribosomal protein L24e n=1 Tax=Rosa chinensis TaxID=74649 RepID=A0A2P6S6Z6_ROSCH|nr:putative ribosomal protein L24e [Rosa chinensis]